MIMIVLPSGPILFFTMQDNIAHDVTLVRDSAGSTGVGKVHDRAFKIIFWLDVALDCTVVPFEVV